MCLAPTLAIAISWREQINKLRQLSIVICIHHNLQYSKFKILSVFDSEIQKLHILMLKIFQYTTKNI